MSEPVQLLKHVAQNSISLDKEQEITGQKTFTKTAEFKEGITVYWEESDDLKLTKTSGTTTCSLKVPEIENDDTLVCEEHPQTLSNKTLENPIIKVNQVALTLPSSGSIASEEWVEGKNYLTEHQSLADYAKTTTTNDLNSRIQTLENIDHTKYALTTHTHTDMATQTWVESKGYLTEHQSLTDYATLTGTEELKNKTLNKPILTQNFVMTSAFLNDTTISLPSYKNVSEYVLLTSQDIENYKNKYVINYDSVQLRALGFGLSHLWMKITVSNIPTNNAWTTTTFYTNYKLESDESSCATGFLLGTAEPFTLEITSPSTLEMKITLPLTNHTITDGDYIIDTLLPTPPSGWIHQLQSSPIAGVGGNGGASVSTQGHYLSWDRNTSTTGQNGRITVK